MDFFALLIKDLVLLLVCIQVTCKTAGYEQSMNLVHFCTVPCGCSIKIDIPQLIKIDYIKKPPWCRS